MTLVDTAPQLAAYSSYVDSRAPGLITLDNTILHLPVV